MIYLKKYKMFLEGYKDSSKIPSYDECVEMCNRDNSSFYESRTNISGYPISLFNYRLAGSQDFNTPKSHEMRGICFVFNEDGTLFKRYILLEKFFNLNQVPDSMYSAVRDLTIKSVYNKEDGSIASFIKLPNGRIIGKSKMGFDNDQANSINRIYKTNNNIKSFVDWCLDNDIVSIFEYVGPTNRIVLRYSKEDLILLRLRDNNTGQHLNLNDYLDKIGDIKIAPFEDENSLDEIIEKAKSEKGREGWVITFSNDQMIKIKTAEYQSLHGLLTGDIYKENVIIDNILNDKIDDVIGQIPEDEVEVHQRINKIIYIIKKSINDKMQDIENLYDIFIKMGENKKEFALKYSKNPNFGYVMSMSKGRSSYEMAKKHISSETYKLMMARDWLLKKDPTLFFTDVPDE